MLRRVTDYLNPVIYPVLTSSGLQLEMLCDSREHIQEDPPIYFTRIYYLYYVDMLRKRYSREAVTLIKHRHWLIRIQISRRSIPSSLLDLDVYLAQEHG